MILEHLIIHGLLYSFVVIIYLFLLMVTTSPRVWGYTDYPQVIKDKVPPQTISERRLATIVSLPWFIFTLGFPIYSTLVLKAKLSHEIPVWTAFLNLFVLFILVTIGDLVLLDWPIISKVTPQFVIIPGTEKEDYKDFSHHFKGHARISIIIIPIFLVIAGMISYL